MKLYIYLVTIWSHKSKDAPIKERISHQRQNVFYEQLKLNRYTAARSKTGSVQFLNRRHRFESCQGYHYFQLCISMLYRIALRGKSWFWSQNGHKLFLSSMPMTSSIFLAAASSIQSGNVLGTFNFTSKKYLRGRCINVYEMAMCHQQLVTLWPQPLLP